MPVTQLSLRGKMVAFLHPSATGSETLPSASRPTAVSGCKDEEDLWRFQWPSDLATDAVSHHLPHSTDAKGLKPDLEECPVIRTATEPLINVLL